MDHRERISPERIDPVNCESLNIDSTEFSVAHLLRVCITLLLVCLALLIKPVLAAPVHVEIVIFANHSEQSGDEWFMRPEEVIKVEEFLDQDLTLSEPQSSEQNGSVKISLDSLEQTGPQPVAAYVLTQFAEVLDEHPDFELLNHLSWVQEPVPKSRTQTILLDTPLSDSIASTELLLAGETSVYEIAQLLQFDIHVTYKPFADREVESVNLPEILKRYSTEFAYVLDERRQVQIDDIHYFDHPKFGIVFTIIRPTRAEFFAQ